MIASGGDDGDPVYGVWCLLPDGADEPITVSSLKSGQVSISSQSKRDAR
jgi:hypothetical protein